MRSPSSGAGLPATAAPLLRRRGRVRDSAGLSAAQRRANLAGTFVLTGRPGAAGALLVLVDDVVTSGATLTEAAAVLAAARARTTRRCSPRWSPRPRDGRRSAASRGDLRVVRKRPENVLRHLADRLSGRVNRD